MKFVMKSVITPQAESMPTRKKLHWAKGVVSETKTSLKSEIVKKIQKKYKNTKANTKLHVEKPKMKRVLLEPTLKVQKISGDEQQMIGAKIVIAAGGNKVYARTSIQDDQGNTQFVVLSRDANKFIHHSLKKGWKLHVELFPHNSFSESVLKDQRMKVYTDFSNATLGTLDEELAMTTLDL